MEKNLTLLTCDKCKKDLNNFNQIYQIPLDASLNCFSGNFCSLPCAKIANRIINDPPRFVEKWKERDRCMQKIYTDNFEGNNNNNNPNIKKKIK